MWVALVLGWSVCGGAGRAEAVALPFAGTLAIQVATYPAIGVSSTGIAVVNGSGAAGHLTGLAIGAGSFVANQVELPVTDPLLFPIVGMRLTGSNQAGTFSGSGGAGFGGAMALAGVMKLCTYPSPCSAAVTNLVVPLAVGAPGTALVTGAVNLTVVGAPWTTGTAVIGTATQMGGVAPLSNTGAPSGSVTLVTPIFISTNTGALPILPTFGTLTLHFVPEPATLGLLAAGVLGLAAWGRKQRRS
jgi:hypothetical protein